MFFFAKQVQTDTPMDRRSSILLKIARRIKILLSFRRGVQMQIRPFRNATQETHRQEQKSDEAHPVAVNKFIDRLRLIDLLNKITYICRDGLMIEKKFRIYMFALPQKIFCDDIEAIIKTTECSQSIAIDTTKIYPERNEQKDE